MSSCNTYLNEGRYSWRHNSILKNLVAYLSSIKKNLCFYADVEGFENPVISGTETRPDVIIVNNIDQVVYIVELTVGIETNITKNCVRKTLRYRELCYALKQQYKTVEYFNLSMGAIGVIGIDCKNVYGFLESVIGLDVIQRNFLIRKLCGVCIRTTYFLFCMRDREWNNPELLYL